MLQVLEFIFSSFWVFFGVLLLISSAACFRFFTITNTYNNCECSDTAEEDE